MGDPTMETFRTAIKAATTNLDEAAEAARPGVKKKKGTKDAGLQALIKEILAGTEAKPDQTNRVARLVADKIDRMIWPERELEVERAVLMKEVDREAERRYIINEVRRILEEEYAR